MSELSQKLMYNALQKRVRHLRSLYVRNLTCSGDTADVASLQAYFTLHRNRRCPAFYKSETVSATLNPSWESLDLTGLDLEAACLCSNRVTVRVWCRSRQEPQAPFVVRILWDVDLRALAYIGDKVDGSRTAGAANVLVLGLWSGYFGAPAPAAAAAATAAAAGTVGVASAPSLAGSPATGTAATAAASPRTTAASAGLVAGSRAPGSSSDPVQWPTLSGSQHMPELTVGTLHPAGRLMRLPGAYEVGAHKLSYSASLLGRLQTVLRALKQTRASVDRIRKNIHTRLRSTEALTCKSSEIEAAELRCRQLRLQVARERQYLLEKRKALLAVDLSNEAIANATGQVTGLTKTESEHVEALKESLRMGRSKLRFSRLLVDMRSKELAAELSCIYPIEQVSDDKFTIAGTWLPNSEDFQGRNDADIAVALGFTAHVVHMLSRFFDIPLQFPLTCCGSRSTVADHVIDRPSIRDGEFPLFSKNKDKTAYRYAVFLLNKNVAQLSWSFGMATKDLRATLPHLHNFFRTKLGMPVKWQERATKPIDVAQRRMPLRDVTQAEERSALDASYSVFGSSGGLPTPPNDSDSAAGVRSERAAHGINGVRNQQSPSADSAGITAACATEPRAVKEADDGGEAAAGICRDAADSRSTSDREGIDERTLGSGSGARLRVEAERSKSLTVAYSDEHAARAVSLRAISAGERHERARSTFRHGMLLLDGEDDEDRGDDDDISSGERTEEAGAGEGIFSTDDRFDVASSVATFSSPPEGSGIFCGISNGGSGSGSYAAAASTNSDDCEAAHSDGGANDTDEPVSGMPVAVEKKQVAAPATDSDCSRDPETPISLEADALSVTT